jgi:hypothetical protein|tara:strand:- start:202 stop:606 length:405 start_codon:yes stop_codon:yes gene_type:complete
MEELQIWTLYSSNRIGTALVSLGIILSIWLSLRIAAATRASDETNLLGKILSTAFGLVILTFSWGQYTIAQNIRVATAQALSNAKESGAELSQVAEGFITNIGTEFTTTPIPLGIIFLVVTGAIILGQIWLPKK